MDGFMLSIDNGVSGILNSWAETETEDGVNCKSVSSSMAVLFKFTNSLSSSLSGMKKVPSGFSCMINDELEDWSVFRKKKYIF